MKIKLNILTLTSLLLIHFLTAQATPTANPSSSTSVNRFESEILSFEKSDQQNFPPLHATLFIGSSSFRLWKNMSKDLTPYTVVNRGFGGAQISDLIYYFNRTVVPYQPRHIFFYAGTNDFAGNKSVETVSKDFLQWLNLLDEKFPETPVYFITISPSPSREKLWPQFQAFNYFVKQESQKRKNLKVLDLWDTLVTHEGKPREELYIADRLHFNEAGYQVWIPLVRSTLETLQK